MTTVCNSWRKLCEREMATDDSTIRIRKPSWELQRLRKVEVEGGKAIPLVSWICDLRVRRKIAHGPYRNQFKQTKVCTLLIMSFLSLLLVGRKIAKYFAAAHILLFFFFALEHLYIFLYQPQWLIFQYNTYRIPCGYIFRVDQPSFKIAQLLFDCFWSDLHIPFMISLFCTSIYLSPCLSMGFIAFVFVQDFKN